MTPTASTPLSSFTFEPQEGGPKFQLRPLSVREVIDVQARSEFVEGQIRFPGAAVALALKAALLGWENLQDDAGAPQAFDDKNVDVNMERLGFSQTMAIFGKIMEASNLSKEQRKN